MMAADINAQLPLVQDPVLNAYVTSLGRVLAKVSERPRLDYRFYVINTATINAFEANKRLADRAIEQVPDDKLHIALDASTNSIAIIMKPPGAIQRPICSMS